MQIEIYDQTKPPADFSADNLPDCRPFEDYAAREDYKARLKICRNLGLTAQSRELTPLYMAISLRVKIPFPFLTHEQEDLLARVFPTRYKQTLTQEDVAAASDLSNLKTLDHYTFDLIPLPVLVTWNDAHERHLFHAWEIWTPERRNRPDPVLIGRRHEHPHPYLVARWGESLQTWEQLSERLGRVLQLPAGRRTA